MQLQAPSHEPHLAAPEPHGDGSARARRAEVVAWLALLLLVGLILWQTIAFGGAPPVEPKRSPAENVELLFQAKYLVGVDALTRPLDGFDLAAAGGDARVVEGLERLAQTPRERLAVAPVLARLGEVERAREIVAGLRADLDLAEEVHGDAEALAGLFDDPPVAPEDGQRARLEREYGWFGELALRDSALVPAGVDAAGPDPVGEARRLAVGVLAAFAVGIGLLALGATLLLVAFVRRRSGRLRSGYVALIAEHERSVGTPSRLARVPYLESLVVFVLAIQILGLVGGGLVVVTGSLAPLLLNWLALPAALWPLVRGRPRGEVLDAVGWRRGEGALRELGAGLVGYLAALPLLACGLVATLLAAGLVERQPHHPIIDWVRGATFGELLVVYMLATLWAPIAEESLFRGSFFHYLRGRFRPLAASLLVALVFAIIHPQGLVAVPFLVSLAVALGLVREWRGSTLAPMAMHFLHNALAVTAMVLLMR